MGNRLELKENIGSGNNIGDGTGRGNGRGTIISISDGSGSGYGKYSCSLLVGIGYGRGSGHGIGIGSSSGSGYGSGYGYGGSYSYGSDKDYGTGSGSGSGVLRRLWFEHIKNKLTARWIIKQTNAEIKRELIEIIGLDRFCAGLDAETIHEDTDNYGNRRRLLRFRLKEAQHGYFQAVQVTCPTTGRVYHLGVDSRVQTCQEAVASTFGMSAEEYHPDRES